MQAEIIEAADKIAVKAVLFDLWGTLVYNVPPSSVNFQEVAAHVGVSPHALWEAWRKYSYPTLIGEIKSGEERARLVLTDLKQSFDAIPFMTEFEYKNRAVNVNFYPGVPQMLTELRQAGFRTGLVSNCNYLTPGVVERLGLPEKIDHVILSCEVGAAKPEARIYEIARQRLDVQPRECLYVGDGGDNEMLGARKFGFHTAIVEQERGHAFRNPGDFGTDFRFAKVTDAPQHITLIAT